MNVTYSDKVKQAGEPLAELQQASKRLETVLGDSASVVQPSWDRAEDEKGRPLYVLRLKDEMGEVTGAFTPSEFESKHQVDFRLYRLWGDLLGIHTRHWVQRLGEN